MKRLVIAAFLLFIPSIAFADAMAQGVCVIEQSKFVALVEKAGSVEKIPTAELFQAGWQGYFDKDLSLDAKFELSGLQFHILVTMNAANTLYSLAAVEKDKSEHLVSVGDIPAGKEVAKDWKREAFVVVLRSGNFLEK